MPMHQVTAANSSHSSLLDDLRRRRDASRPLGYERAQRLRDDEGNSLVAAVLWFVQASVRLPLDLWRHRAKLLEERSPWREAAREVRVAVGVALCGALLLWIMLPEQWHPAVALVLSLAGWARVWKYRRVSPSGIVQRL